MPNENTETGDDLRALVAQILSALKDAQTHLEYCGYGDRWERECAKASKLETVIERAVEAGDRFLKPKRRLRRVSRCVAANTAPN